MAFRLLGVGGPLLDLLLSVDDDFLAAWVPGAKGGMEPVTGDWIDALLAASPRKPLIRPGGSAGNTVFALNQLGVDAALWGKLGNDARGGVYRDFCRRYGVDTSELLTGDFAPTGCCLSLITPDAERTMRSALGISLEVTLPELARVDFSYRDAVLIEGYMAYSRIFPELLRRASASGCYVALDLASFEVVKHFYCQLTELLRYVDLVLANAAEMAALTGVADPASALAELKTTFDGDVVIKLGADGVLADIGKTVLTAPAEPVTDVVDTTAAGDLWSAGYFYGVSCKLSAASCLRWGARCAAEVIRQPGSLLPPEAIDRLRKIKEG